MRDKKDLKNLVSHCHNMARHLLTNQSGEFYPFGAKVDNGGQVINVGHHDNNEFPKSQDLINNFRKYFKKELKGQKIKGYAITFDCKAKKDDLSKETNAIGIEYKMTDLPYAMVYYFPYNIDDIEDINTDGPWGHRVDEEE